jgi:Yip1-like protein
MIGNVLKSCQFYGYAVIQILIEPRRFFTELPKNATMAKSLGFCVICSLFYTAASLLTGTYPSPIKMGGVFFINNVAMVFLPAGLSYMILVMIRKKKSRFPLLFSVCAFSSGITLLVSWMSMFLWFTEPWKWWLIYTGFKNTCGIPWKASLVILVLTMIIEFFFSVFLLSGLL